jgi:hypothetical protein
MWPIVIVAAVLAAVAFARALAIESRISGESFLEDRVDLAPSRSSWS